jgi:2-dehydropantoate 2-reductase
MRCAVIGAGGIGGYFGGRLAAAGHDVSFVARGAHLEAIREEGLLVSSVAGDFVVRNASATSDPADIGPVDFVLLGVKTWQVPGVAATIAPLMGPETGVVTTQNGVEAPGQVAAVVGESAVLPGVAKVFASIEGPGHIQHSGGPGSLSLAEWDNHPSERVDRLREALTGAGIPSPVPQDIWVELWAKVVFVEPFGALGAALDATIGELRTSDSRRGLLEDAMREVEAVARARQVALPEDIVARTLDFIDQQPPDGTSSLQRDLVAERPSELDAWVGALVRLGTAAGLPVPLHRLLLEVLTTRHPHALGH